MSITPAQINQMIINMDRVRNEKANVLGQMRIGELITELEKVFKRDLPVEYDVGCGPSELHSYRGYYSDLALGQGSEYNVGELTDKLKGILGYTLEGYKGGDFTMTAKTLVWSASYGTCQNSRKIVGVKPKDNKVILLTMADED